MLFQRIRRAVSTCAFDPQAVARDTQLFHHLRNEWTFTPHWSKPLSPPTHGQGKRSVMRGLNEATGLMQRDIVAPDSLADSTWLAFNVDFSFRGALYAQAGEFSSLACWLYRPPYRFRSQFYNLVSMVHPAPLLNVACSQLVFR